MSREKVSPNLELWARYYTPPKDACKDFQRAGGFKGTAVDPMWLIRCATEQWGPMGGKWGLNIIDEQFVTLDQQHILHISSCDLWYDDGSEEPAVLPCVGQTWAVSTGKSGPIFDEECVKKSRTDAIGKGLSWLGFSGAVHMGAFDGNKYTHLPENAQEITPTDARAQAHANATTDAPGPVKAIALAVWNADAPAVYASAGTDDEKTAKNHLLGVVRRTARRLNVNIDNHPNNDEMAALERETSAAIHAAAEDAAQGGAPS